jgi:hypothetical protein
LSAESNPADYASKLKRLPQSLQGAVESLCADKVLHELIGDKLVTAAIAIRKVFVLCKEKPHVTFLFELKLDTLTVFLDNGKIALIPILTLKEATALMVLTSMKIIT